MVTSVLVDLLRSMSTSASQIMRVYANEPTDMHHPNAMNSHDFVVAALFSNSKYGHACSYAPVAPPVASDGINLTAARVES